VILAYLAQREANGYQILKVVNDAIGPFARMSKGRFYPLLNQLEQRGLIRAVKSERPSRTYRLTPAGRRRLRLLMLDTQASAGSYQRMFTLKAMVLELLPGGDQEGLVEHYKQYCETNIEHLRAEAHELEQLAATRTGPPFAAAIARVMRHEVRRWQLELEFVAELERQPIESGQLGV
jgi:DNA-binding PadR family transcriptional regulator